MVFRDKFSVKNSKMKAKVKTLYTLINRTPVNRKISGLIDIYVFTICSLVLGERPFLWNKLV